MPPAPFDIGDVTKGAVAAVAFLLSFAPGFVAMKTYDWFAEAEPRKVQDLLYEIIGYSSVTYAFASPLLAAALLSYVQTRTPWQHYAIVAGAAIVCILLLPFGLGLAVAALQNVRNSRTPRSSEASRCRGTTHSETEKVHW